MKRIIIVLFIQAFISILISCTYRENYLENVYPSDINIPDVGTLKYIRTIWDQNDKNNRRGVEIYDAKIIDGEIWMFVSNNWGCTLFKGINRAAHVTIQYPDKNDLFFRYSVKSYKIIPKSNYLVFHVSRNNTEYYENSSMWVHYIARVHTKTLEREYIRMSNRFDGWDWLLIHYGNGDVFFEFSVFDPSVDEIVYSYYMLNDDCDDVVEITEIEFKDLFSPNPEFVIDNQGRYYRLNIYNNNLEVSVDNGTTWFGNDMGTNVPKSIIIEDNLIYVFCGQIYESFGKFHSEYVGGGIHVFRWE